VFADWILEQLEVNPNFIKQIIFSDEAHFWMNGYVNKQNCQIWDDINPREIPHLQMQIPRKSLFGATESSTLLPNRSGRCHNRQRRALQIDDKQLLVA